MAKYNVTLTGKIDEQKTSKQIQDVITKVEKSGQTQIKIKLDLEAIKKQEQYLSKEFATLYKQRKQWDADEKISTVKNNQEVYESVKAVLDEKEKLLKVIQTSQKDLEKEGADFDKLTDKINEAKKGVANLNNELSKLGADKSSNNKVLSYNNNLSKADNSALSYADNKGVKVVNELITLENKLANSRKISRSAEAQALQSTLAQQKENIRLYKEAVKAYGAMSPEAMKYRDVIEATDRTISTQKVSLKALENQSLNFWEKLSEKARDYFNYAVAAMTLQQAAQAVRSMIDNVIELDSSLVELRKVTDLEGQSLDRFVDKAYEVSTEVARTGREMIDATTEFAKSGYDPNTALELGKIALMYGNIADEEVSAGESANFIIAQMKAFNIEAKDAMHIIDTVNEVSNNFAVSSADIANNLGKASAVMANAGNSMEEYIAMMTAITEITRSADKAANGLKTLTLRLQGMNDEGEKDLEVQAKMEELFNKLGISVYKSNGELKNTYEIMGSLAPIYKTLTNAEKAYVTETIAGKYQAQNAAALLNNWSQAVKANETAINSQGSALTENGKVLDSIEGKINAFRSAFQKLSKDVISSDLIKFVVDLGTGFLTLANNDTVQFIAKMTALIVVLNLLSKTTIVKTISALMSLATTEGTTATSTFAFQLALERLNKSAFGKLIISIGTYIKTLITMAATQGVVTASTFALKGALDLITAHPIIFTLTAVITALSLMKAHTQALRDEIDSLENDLDGLSEISDRLGEISTELDDENITLQEQQNLFKEIKDIQQKLRKEYGLNTEALDTQTGKIQDQVKALKEYVELKEREKNLELLDKTVELGPGVSLVEFVLNPSRWFDGFTKEGQQRVENEVEEYTNNVIKYAKGSNKEIQDAFKEFENSISDKDITADALSKRYAKVIETIRKSKLSDEIKSMLIMEAGNINNDYLVVLEDTFNKQNAKKYIDMYKSSIEFELKIMASKGLDKNYFEELLKKDILNDEGFPVLDKMLSNLTTNEFNFLSPFATAASKAGVPLKEFIDILAQMYPTIQTVEDMTTQTRTEFKLLGDQLDNIKNAYNTVKDALEEYNETGYFSIDTLYKLLALDNDSMNALMDENGKIRDNTNAFKVLTEAKLDDIQASEDTRYYNELLKLAHLKEAEVALFAAGSIHAHNDAMAGQEVNAEQLRAQIKENIKAFNEESAAALQAAYDIAEARHNQNNAAIKNTRTGLNINLNKALGRNTKSSKSEKEWWEKELQSLKDQFNDNEITIEEYINGLDKLLGKTQKGSEAWKKINEELQKQRLSKVEDDYKAGRISLEQYIAKLKELLKAYKEGTKAWNELAEKIKKGLQDQAKETKSDYDDAKSAIDKVIDDEINKLQEEIDLLKEKNDQKERDIELTRLKDALENAKKNKNKRVWNGSEWVWMADQSAIDDAQKALDDFLLQDKTDALQKQIDDLNDLKNQYADVTKIYDQEQQKQQLIAMLGANAEADILNQRIDTLNKFKDKYLDIQKQIANYDKATPESLVGGKSPSTSTGGGGTSGGSNNSGTSQAEIDAIARDVIRGKYGNGQARKNALGDKYSAVQARVNQMLSGRSYAGGGIVDYTGLAMLHGSPNKPEMVLNYDQIKTFMGMLSRPEVRSNITNTGQSIIYNFSGDFNLPNVNNAQQFLRDLKSQVNIKRHSI